VVVEVLEVDVVEEVDVDDVLLVGVVVVVVVVVVFGHLALRVIVTASGPPFDVGSGFSLMLPAEIGQLTEPVTVTFPALTPADTASTNPNTVTPTATPITKRATPTN
jgi:hypothetical protein